MAKKKTNNWTIIGVVILLIMFVVIGVSLKIFSAGSNIEQSILDGCIYRTLHDDRGRTFPSEEAMKNYMLQNLDLEDTSPQEFLAEVDKSQFRVENGELQVCTVLREGGGN